MAVTASALRARVREEGDDMLAGSIGLDGPWAGAAQIEKGVKII
jgi:hypothetical protein